MTRAHACEGGPNCVQRRGLDLSRIKSGENSMICMDCIPYKQETLYCSGNCALDNLSHHRQRVHRSQRFGPEAPKLVVPLSDFIDSTLAKKNPGMRFLLAD